MPRGSTTRTTCPNAEKAVESTSSVKGGRACVACRGGRERERENITALPQRKGSAFGVKRGRTVNCASADLLDVEEHMNAVVEARRITPACMRNVSTQRLSHVAFRTNPNGATLQDHAAEFSFGTLSVRASCKLHETVLVLRNVCHLEKLSI